MLRKTFRAIAAQLTVLAGFAALAAAAPAAASPLRFSFSGAVVGTFDLDSTPTPVHVYASSTMVPIANGTGRFAGFNVATFYEAAAAGGFYATDYLTLSAYADFYGQQLYSGTLSNPVFTTGSYSLGTRTAFRDIVLEVTNLLGRAPVRGGPGAPGPELGAGWMAALAAAMALAVTRRRRQGAVAA